MCVAFFMLSLPLRHYDCPRKLSRTWFVCYMSHIVSAIVAPHMICLYLCRVYDEVSAQRPSDHTPLMSVRLNCLLAEVPSRFPSATVICLTNISRVLWSQISMTRSWNVAHNWLYRHVSHIHHVENTCVRNFYRHFSTLTLNHRAFVPTRFDNRWRGSNML